MEKVEIKPMTINRAWKGRRFKTDEYKKWRNDMVLLLPRLKEFKGRLAVSIVFGFSNVLSDIDNPVKAFLDSLKDKYGIDDRYIYELTVKKEVVKKGKEFIEFEITEL